ncbi:MAG: Vps62-related protein, partial [Allosphingosinicella sp.]
WIGDDHHGGAHLDCSWWEAVPPQGFVALGTVFVGYHGMPPRDAIACVREDLAGPAKGGKMVYADRGSHATHDVEIFEVYAAAPGCVQIGASVVSSSYIMGSPPELSGVAVAALKPPARADRSDALSAADVEAIIAKSGPLLLLHPQEEWLPLAADIFVDAATRSGNYLTVSDPDVLKGDLKTARAYVFANYVCSQFTDLQFWFFYGYNGAPFVQIQLWLASGGTYLWSTEQDEDNLNCGQHQGDWETVTLRVDNQQKKVVAVGYTSHGDTEWYAAPDGQVKAYAALHVHGCYPVPGEFLELAAWQEQELTLAHLEVKVFSRNICADGGATFDASTRYEIVESNFLPGIVTPDWLGPDFAGVEWGPVVEHEDQFTFSLPLGISYDYDHKQTDSGANTPAFSVD